MRRLLAISVFVVALDSSAFAQTTSGASSSVSINNPAATDTTARVIAAPPVGAPGLAAAGMETCLGSATGGLSIMGGGFTFGRTYPDEGCNIRLAARQLYAFGFQKAAIALMCQDPHVAEAMQAVGQPCVDIIMQTRPQRRAAAQDVDPTVTGSIDRNDTSRAPARKTIRGGERIGTIPAAKIIPWKNPDDIAPDETPEPTRIAADSDETRWFARMTAIY